MAPGGNRAKASVQFYGILPRPYRQDNRITRGNNVPIRDRNDLQFRAHAPDKCTRLRLSRASRKFFGRLLVATNFSAKDQRERSRRCRYLTRAISNLCFRTRDSASKRDEATLAVAAFAQVCPRKIIARIIVREGSEIVYEAPNFSRT
jgi:hypothetical protein